MSKSSKQEINQLKQELERIEKEGFGALKPIYNFYENTVTNILKKLGTVNQVTDEYGNTWNEVIPNKDNISFKIAQSKLSAETTYYGVLENIFDNNLYKTHYSKDIVQKILDNNYLEDPELKEIAKSLQGINVKIKFEDSPDYYMKYNDGSNTIFISRSNIYHGNLDYFSRSVLHEVMHAYTIDSYKNPRSDKQKEFKATIDKAYNDNKKFFKDYEDYTKTSDKILYYGLKNPIEFIAEVITNPEFRKELETKKTGFFTRILNAIRELLGLNSKQLPVVKTILDLVDEVNKGNIEQKEGNSYNSNTFFKIAPDKTYGDYEVYNGFAMQLSNVDKMKVGDKRTTIRTRFHPSGTYKFGDSEFNVLNLGKRNISSFKNKSKLKSNFIQDEEIKYQHIDDFFNGKRDLYVYQITKIDNTIKNQAPELSEDVENAETTTISPNSPLEKLNDFIAKEEAIYKKLNQNHPLLKDISEIKEQIANNLPDLDIFTNFIKQALKWQDSALDRINKIKDKLTDKEFNKMDPKEQASIVDQLNQIKSLLGGYTIIDEIEKLLTDDNVDNLMSKLVKDRRKVLKLYTELSYDLQSKFLSSYAGGFLTEEQIKDELIMGSSDIGLGQYFMGATISSTDPIAALTAKATKDVLEDARIENYNNELQLLSIYNNTSGNKSDVKDFNKNYIEYKKNYEFIPDTDKDGNSLVDPDGNQLGKWGYVDRAGFVEEYDYDILEKNKRDFFDALGPKPEERKAAGKWSNKVRKWFNENTQVINPVELIERKKKELSTRAFNLWLEDNLKELDDNYVMSANDFSSNMNPRTVNQNLVPEKYRTKQGDKYYIYSGEFVKPANKYINPRFASLMSDPYYNKLYTLYKESNDSLPKNQKLKYGIIPQILVSGYDKAQNTGLNIKDQLKNIWNWMKFHTNVSNIDSQYGITDLSGQEHKYIPVYYNTLLDDNSLSYDLLQSTLLFSKMAVNREHLSSIEPHINMIKDLLKGNTSLGLKPREIAKTNAKGIQVLDSVLKKTFGKQGTKYSNEQLEQFIDDIFYGEGEKQATVDIFGNEISLNKISNNWLSYTSISMLAGNLVSAVNNITFGNYSTLNEATAGEYMSTSDWAFAQKTYGMNIGSFVADTQKITNKSLLTQLANYYDAFQGEYTDKFGRNISGTLAKRLFQSDMLFMLTNGAEHQIQMTGFIGLLKHKKIKTKSGEEISLLDAYELDDKGFLKLKDNIEFTESDRKNFTNIVHALGKQLNGNYNKFDKSTLQRNWLGKLVIMFRKHIYTGFKRRYGKKQIDFELMSETEGYYRLFMQGIKSGLRSSKSEALWNWSKLSIKEKQGFKKTMSDVVAMTATFLLFSLLKAAADDDEDNVMINHLALQARRLQGDINFYLPLSINPGKYGVSLGRPDSFRLLKTPAVSMSTLEKTWDVLEQLTTDPTEEYQKNSKLHDKGDYKILYKTKRLMPIINQAGNLVAPENQLQVFR